MALAAVVDSLDTVPEPLRKEYVPRDGKFVLDLTGAPVGFVSVNDHAAIKNQVAEFRNNNIALTQERDALLPLKEQFKDLDPVAARAAIAKVKELGDKGIKGGEDLKALIEAAITPLTTEISTLKAAGETERKRADDAVFKSSISDIFVGKAGGEPSALDFIVGRARDVFTMQNGVMKAAPNKFSVDKPGEPLTVDEWITQQTKETPFAFKPSAGSGARQGDGNITTTQHKPGVTVIKDPTPQQLGQYASDVKAGKVVFEYTK